MLPGTLQNQHSECTQKAKEKDGGQHGAKKVMAEGEQIAQKEISLWLTTVTVSHLRISLKD